MLGNILITGASGWLGKSSISYLLHRGCSLSQLLLVASEDKFFNVGNFHKVKAENYSKFETIRKIDGVIHLAFLTREKSDVMGLTRYSSINQEITQKAVKIIRQTEPNWVVTVSSGAIFNPITKHLETNIATNPYGFLKLREEEELTFATKTVGANLVIGRLWGASGSLMPINRSYALSDFIVQAVTDKKIEIKAAHEVYRRYVDAEIFMAVLLERAISGKSESIDSGGSIVEIGDLAKIVADQLNIENINRPRLLNAEIDDYYPRGDQFATIAAELNLPISEIREQVANTIEGHLSLL